MISELWQIGLFQKLKDELKKRGAQSPSDTREPKLLSMLIHSLILEREQMGRIGRIGRNRSSGAMSVDPRSSGAMSIDPRSSGAMSVDPPM